MTPTVCSRLWQVQAARDGRLAGKELASAVRHRADCPDCAREERALSELRGAIQSLRAPAPAPLRVHRTRQALLAAFNQHLLGTSEPEPRTSLRWRVALLAACAVALTIGHAFWRRVPAPDRDAPFYDVVSKPGTLWSARKSSSVTRIRLGDGFASFAVRRPADQRFFIDLPDGEIEDSGTVFEVEVREGRTVHISVSRGRVFVRLQSRSAFALHAGQSWQPEASAPPVTAAAPPPVTAAAPPPVAAAASPSTAVQPRQTESTPKPSADNAEDDAYLQIVDLLRNGHELEARAKAAQYLAQFPSGFRRVEVQNIVRR